MFFPKLIYLGPFLIPFSICWIFFLFYTHMICGSSFLIYCSIAWVFMFFFLRHHLFAYIFISTFCEYFIYRVGVTLSNWLAFHLFYSVRTLIPACDNASFWLPLSTLEPTQVRSITCSFISLELNLCATWRSFGFLYTHKWTFWF